MEILNGIDICICTYNRVEYLKQCVELLVPQLSSPHVDLTIIDNNSSDNTRGYVQSLILKNIPLRYFLESSQGISHARNRGWKESRRDWILYIDDECLPPPNLLAEAFNSIQEHGTVAAMGGPIYAVHSFTPPSWLPDGFGDFKMPYDHFTIIDRGYIRCGCFLIQNEILRQLGGFKPELGMKGYTLAYGEELELQDRLRAAGYKIGYAPTLKIGHQVRIEKINTKWILHSEYARRRDKMAFAPIGIGSALAGILRTSGGRIIHAPVYAFKLLLKKDYTLNHAILDFTKPLMYRYGEFAGVLKKNFR